MPGKKYKKPMSQAQKKQERICWLLIALPVIGFLVFSVYPILWTFSKSFYHYNMIPSETVFVGLRNFKHSFSDEKYWNGWITALQFTGYKLVLEIPLAMIIALILNGNIRGKGFYRAVYFLPHLISLVVAGVIFGNMFNYLGFINGFLKNLGFSAVDWFGSKFSSLTVMTLASTWGGVGVNILYFIAALANVPDDVYEAAAIDGAGKFTTFFKITMPMIAPMFMTVLLLTLNANIRASDLSITLTAGAPRGTTHTFMSYLTKEYVPGFTTESSPNIGYGSAQYMITTCILCIWAFLYMKLKNKVESIFG